MALNLRPVTGRELVAWSAPAFRMPPRGGVPAPVYPFPPSYEIRPCPPDFDCPSRPFGACCGYHPWEGVSVPFHTLQEALDRYNERGRSVDD